MARAPELRPPAARRQARLRAADHRGGAAGAAGVGQARRARAAREWLLERHGSEVLASSTATRARACARCRGSAAPGCGRRSRSWQQQAGGRALRLLLAEHGVPARGRRARLQRAGRRRDRRCWHGIPTRWPRSRASPSPPPTRSPARSAPPADAPGGIDAALHHALRAAEQDGHCFLPRVELVPRARAAARAAAATSSPRGRAERPRRSTATASCEPRDGPHRGTGSPSASASCRGRAADARRRRARRAAADGAIADATQWSAVHARCRAPAVDPHRRPGHRQDRDDARARRPAAGRTSAPCGCARRRARRRGGCRRPPARRGHDDPPAAGVRAGRGLRPRRRRPARPASTCSSSTRPPCSTSASPPRCWRRSAPRTHVLLVGDVDQLAPVGPGRVLEDLIASRRGARDPADRGLPPGRALADHPRRARDRPRRAAADRRPAPTTSATSSWSSATSADASSTRSSRWPRGACPATTTSTPSPTCRCSCRCTRARRDRRVQRPTLRARAQPRRARRQGHAVPPRRPHHADAQQPRARAFNGEIGVIVANDPAAARSRWSATTAAG